MLESLSVFVVQENVEAQCWDHNMTGDLYPELHVALIITTLFEL
jgi:hypothetical protein